MAWADDRDQVLSDAATLGASLASLVQATRDAVATEQAGGTPDPEAKDANVFRRHVGRVLRDAMIAAGTSEHELHKLLGPLTEQAR